LKINEVVLLSVFVQKIRKKLNEMSRFQTSNYLKKNAKNLAKNNQEAP
jgi:hypothetical protein